jgi:hypothetical protein
MVLGGQAFDAATIDGLVASFTSEGQLRWARHLQGTRVAGSPWLPAIYPEKIAIEGGHIYVTGSYQGSLAVGTEIITAASDNSSGFLVSLDLDGNVRWARSIGQTTYVDCLALATGDNVVDLGGMFLSQLTFGPDTLITHGHRDVFVAEFGADGSYRWSTSFGGSDDGDTAVGLARDPAGDVYVTGTYQNVVRFPGETLTPQTQYSDGYIASFSPAGGFRWAFGFGSTVSSYGALLAMDTQGKLTMAGGYQGSLTLASVGLPVGDGWNAVVAKSTVEGVLESPTGFPSNGAEVTFRGLSSDPRGGVYLTGRFTRTANFGGGPLQAPDGVTAFFVVSFAENGSHRWSKSFFGEQGGESLTLASDARNHVYLGGVFYGSLNLEDTVLRSNGSSDGFLVRFDDP